MKVTVEYHEITVTGQRPLSLDVQDGSHVTTLDVRAVGPDLRYSVVLTTYEHPPHGDGNGHE